MSNIDTINVGGVDFGIGGTPGLFYDSYEEAETDLANIEDGTLVYTPEPDSTIQDIIDGMTSLHLVGTQRGVGSTNVTVITESSKRLLAITKKSGVIVETKEIPTSVLESGDVVLLGALGNTAPIIISKYNGTLPSGRTQRQTNQKINVLDWSSSSGTTTSEILGVNSNVGNAYSLSADLSDTTGAKLTYNGSNSFTITVSDSTLSVFLYTDMLVLGGSASGRNVSFDASGTSLSATDVEGAIKELNNDLSELKNITSAETIVGRWNGETLYRKVIIDTNTHTSNFLLDNTITLTNSKIKNITGAIKDVDGYKEFFATHSGSALYQCEPRITNNGVEIIIVHETVYEINLILYYTKK